MGNEKETHERPPAPVYQESPSPGDPEPQRPSQSSPKIMKLLIDKDVDPIIFMFGLPKKLIVADGKN